MRFDQTTFESLAALALGFAFAGMVASTFEMLTRRTVRLALLETRDLAAIASIPLLVFAGPLLIIRAILVRPKAARPGLGPTAVAAAIAALWSLASGRIVLDLAHLVTGA